jgi:zinc/manganese transport system substrate-binding protein
VHTFSVHIRSATPFAVLLALAALLVTATGCGSSVSDGTGGRAGVLRVVAGENFWGSVAAQLGGSHVSITSIVTNPNTDPHEYASSTATARDFAGAQYVILNGAGYDSWGQKLLDANPISGRRVFVVADLLGKRAGDNPHFWYNPDYVAQVAARITADYQAMDPADAAIFSQLHAAFVSALTPYRNHVAAIRAAYTGRKIGATESIIVYLASALGLDLISPPAFMQAISEGTDPPVSAVTLFHQQIEQRQIAVLVYNRQTTTTLTTSLEQLASQNNIPTVGVTEAMQPLNTTFQDWQDTQLTALQRALSASATGK